MSDAITIAKTCAKFADEIQAENIVVLDLRGISSIADYFVICTATSVPHLKAVNREIRRGTEDELGEKPRSGEGDPSSLWLIIDYVDVVVHIFNEEKRDQYSLEDLWSDAPRVSFDFLEAAEAARAAASEARTSRSASSES
ncbi:MAG: ribosome silencing factor [Verrucomicrobiales bacterium]|nr:ribosome silencing factor [Verrucomicrobiales bacterium]